jgi:hypothetical protein
MEQWAAQWWKQVLETRMHAPDGSISHPNFDETGAQGAQGDVGEVFFLFGTFFPPGAERTITVPAGKPIFVPVIAMEFSNFDTATPDGNFPGEYSAAELKRFAKDSAKSVKSRGELHASVDGRNVRGLAGHREDAPVSYTLPAEDNVLQFFGLPFSGPVSPAFVDGFYFMLKPLSPGQHVIEFGGTIPTNPPPLLSDFTIEMTYNVNVVPTMQQADDSPRSPFGAQLIGSRVLDLLEPEVNEILV